MKLANTKRIKEKIMEIAQTKQALDMINAIATNEVSNSTIDPEMLTSYVETTQKSIETDG